MTSESRKIFLLIQGEAVDNADEILERLIQETGKYINKKMVYVHNKNKVV